MILASVQREVCSESKDTKASHFFLHLACILILEVTKRPYIFFSILTLEVTKKIDLNLNHTINRHRVSEVYKVMAVPYGSESQVKQTEVIHPAGEQKNYKLCDKTGIAQFFENTRIRNVNCNGLSISMQWKPKHCLNNTHLPGKKMLEHHAKDDLNRRYPLNSGMKR